jgi:acid phosphatase family membrane protein YuiD
MITACGAWLYAREVHRQLMLVYSAQIDIKNMRRTTNVPVSRTAVLHASAARQALCSTVESKTVCMKNLTAD